MQLRYPLEVQTTLISTSLGPNSADLYLTRSKQQRCPPYRVQIVPIPTSPGPNSADLHPSSLPLSSLSFLTSGFCLYLEKKFLDLLCGWTGLWVCVCLLVYKIGIMCLWVWFFGFEKSVPMIFFFFFDKVTHEFLWSRKEIKKNEEEEEEKKWPLERVREEERRRKHEIQKKSLSWASLWRRKEIKNKIK